MPLDKKLLEGVPEDTAKLLEEAFSTLENGHSTALSGKDTELSAANQTIKSLQEAVKKFDGVDVGKLQGDLAALEKKYTDDIAASKLEHALDMALVGAKARDSKAVKPFLDMNAVKLEGEKLQGLDSQLANLKKDKSFLFEEISQTGGSNFSSGFTHSTEDTGNFDSFAAAAMKGAGLQKD